MITDASGAERSWNRVPFCPTCLLCRHCVIPCIHALPLARTCPAVLLCWLCIAGLFPTGCSVAHLALPCPRGTVLHDHATRQEQTSIPLLATLSMLPASTALVDLPGRQHIR